jgi:hypothetical protein
MRYSGVMFVFLTLKHKVMDFLMVFFVAMLSYLLLSIYLVIVALSEQPIRQYKVLISFSAFLFSLYALVYYFEAVYPRLTI